MVLGFTQSSDSIDANDLELVIYSLGKACISHDCRAGIRGSAEIVTCWTCNSCLFVLVPAAFWFSEIFLWRFLELFHSSLDLPAKIFIRGFVLDLTLSYIH